MVKKTKIMSKDYNDINAFHRSKKTHQLCYNELKGKLSKTVSRHEEKENLTIDFKTFSYVDSKSDESVPFNQLSNIQSQQSKLIAPQYYINKIRDCINTSGDLDPNQHRYLTHFHFVRKCFEVIKNLPIEDIQYSPCSESISRKTLVLDLDETLIHTFEKDIPSDCIQITANIYDKCEKTIHFKIRPYCKEFLDTMSIHYDICVFTAGHSTYANPIIDYLDPERRIFKARYFYESCRKISKYIVKDLRVLNKNLKDVIIVDNTILCFGYQKENGVPIVCYTGEENDQELVYLKDFLLYLNSYSDVRKGIMKHFRWDQLARFYRDSQALRKYYF